MLQLVMLTVCSLPLSVTSRVLNTHDLPNLLVQLVESPPWSRRINGTLGVSVCGGRGVCVHVCVCVCVRVCVCVCVCVCMCVRVCVCMDGVCLCVWVCVCAHACKSDCVCVCERERERAVYGASVCILFFQLFFVCLFFSACFLCLSGYVYMHVYTWIPLELILSLCIITDRQTVQVCGQQVEGNWSRGAVHTDQNWRTGQLSAWHHFFLFLCHSSGPFQFYVT